MSEAQRAMLKRQYGWFYLLSKWLLKHALVNLINI